MTPTAILLSWAVAASSSYSIDKFEAPRGYQCISHEECPGNELAALNDRGDVALNKNSQFHALIMQGGRTVELPANPGYRKVLAINDAGDGVGYASFCTGNCGGMHHAVLWRQGRAIDLDPTGKSDSEARGINRQGWVVGQMTFPLPQGGEAAHPFLWKGSVLDLGTLGGWGGANAINDRGQVVGGTMARADMQGFKEDTFQAFLWEDGVMTNLGTLGGPSSEAVAINGSGVVVGWSTDASKHKHAFRWERRPGEAKGTMTDLGVLGGTESEALGINDAGVIVGNSDFQGHGRIHAFAWQSGVMTDLGTLGGTSSHAVAINAQGEVLGYATAAVKTIEWVGRGLGKPERRTEDENHLVLWKPGRPR